MSTVSWTICIIFALAMPETEEQYPENSAIKSFLVVRHRSQPVEQAGARSVSHRPLVPNPTQPLGLEQMLYGINSFLGFIFARTNTWNQTVHEGE
jgi:hypothetical protein